MAERLNTYEFTYIVNAVLSDEQIKDVVGRVSGLVTENGGEILEVDEWGSQRLAFPLSKKRNGYYVNMYFKAPGDLVQKHRDIATDDLQPRCVWMRRCFATTRDESSGPRQSLRKSRKRNSQYAIEHHSWPEHRTEHRTRIDLQASTRSTSTTRISTC